MSFKFKTLLPKGLYGRAALILIVPVVSIQLVVSVAFIQRHFERVTRQMTGGVVIEISYLRDQIDAAPSLQEAQAAASEIAAALKFQVDIPASHDSQSDVAGSWDLSGREVIATLRDGLEQVHSVELLDDPRRVRLLMDTSKGPVSLVLDRGRLSASNPHQLLVLMIVTSILMTLVAYFFLRNQLRPIKRLSEAAAAFGKGRQIAYHPRGALEVRAAGHAFLDMRARIERQIEQRTLLLSGISHDLRTPLTRLRLGISMLPSDAETEALLRDVSDMQRLVDEFLAFVRGDALEDAEMTDPVRLVQHIVENARRVGQPVEIGSVEGQGEVRLRPTAITRAIENLIGNAVRFGTRAEVSIHVLDRSVRVTVEDNGPGIPKDDRETAMNAFTRLDSARDPNRGGGVGLGLSIAIDIARNHGGTLRLLDSEKLGGLRADLIIAR